VFLPAAALLGGCGGGRIVCGSSAITDVTAAGVGEPVALQISDLPPTPSDWTTRTRGQLTVTAPPPEASGSQWVIDEPEADGTTCITWNGQLFADTAGELGAVEVKPGHDIGQLVDTANQRFTVFTLAGADTAAARIVQEPCRDGADELIPGERATALEAILTAQGSLYRVSLTLQPGDAGIEQARQVLAALRLS
jgi:hypothetical protein